MKYKKFAKDIKRKLSNILPNQNKMHDNTFKDTVERDGEHYTATFRILHPTVWPRLKKEILHFYKEYYFTDIVINKEFSLMLKNAVTQDAYVNLFLKGDIVTLELYHAVEPDTETINIYLN
jgi:hypothetical protein